MLTSVKIIKVFAETPGFFVLGPVVTTSGYTNPIYPESRRTFSYPNRLQIIIDELKKFIRYKKIKYDIIFGGATAGIMLSSPLSMQLGTRQGYVRTKSKGGGLNLTVEGSYKKGDRAIIVDDATASGKHKIPFIKNIRQSGLKVDWVIVPFARNHKSAHDQAWIKKMGVKYQSFCDLHDIRKYAEEHNIITPEASQIIKWYTDNPTSWHKNKKQWQFFQTYLKHKNRSSKTGI